ncbi:CD225/dispanin family protein [Gemmata sp.]|uniref:CD225/dispanin family protein n=1 Tax=Gemmata sp. TaxID=1914242 RepID=UPI003F7072C5
MARDRYDDPRPWDRDDDHNDDRGRGRGRQGDWEAQDDDGYDPRPAAPPPNNMALAVFTTLCCCTPGGVVAIVYASQVSSKWALGDYAGAQQSAANAKMWCWVSIILGFAIGLASAVLQIMAEQQQAGGIRG